MSYVAMDHAKWMNDVNGVIRARALRKPSRRILPLPPETLSPFQAAVVNILGIVGGGIYNAPINPETIEWDERYVGVRWCRELASFDFNALTNLVFLCHEARIRLSIEPAMRDLSLTFWRRKAEGGLAVRHPNLDEAVTEFRRWFPADHSINYRAEDPAK